MSSEIGEGAFWRDVLLHVDAQRAEKIMNDHVIDVNLARPSGAR